MDLVAPVGDDDQRGKVGEPTGEVVEELPGRGVGPVDVLDRQEQSALACGEGEQRDDRLEQTQLRLAGIGRSLRSSGRGQAREELRELRQAGAQRARELVGVRAVEVVSDRLHEGQVGQRQLGVAAAAGQHGAPQLPSLAPKLAGQPGLADSGLAGERHETALAATRGEERLLQRRKLVIPADQDRTECASRHPVILPQERALLPLSYTEIRSPSRSRDLGRSGSWTGAADSARSRMSDQLTPSRTSAGTPSATAVAISTACSTTP